MGECFHSTGQIGVDGLTWVSARPHIFVLQTYIHIFDMQTNICQIYETNMTRVRPCKPRRPSFAQLHCAVGLGLLVCVLNSAAAALSAESLRTVVSPWFALGFIYFTNLFVLSLLNLVKFIVKIFN